MLKKYRLSVINFVLLGSLMITSSWASAQTPPANSAKNNDAINSNMPLPTKSQIFQIGKDEIVFGDNKAPLTIIEYASLSCPHCANFYQTTLPKIKEKYINSGKVRFIYRDFPLNEPALRASMLVKCATKAEQEKFINVLYSTQDNWGAKKNYLEILSNIAKLGGMSGKDFDKCMADKNIEDNILKSRFYAAKVLNLNSTPTFFINEEKHEGSSDFNHFSNFIDEVLNKTKKP